MTPQTKDHLIKTRMAQINVQHRSYYVRNDNNIRLCHLQEGEYNYLVFPFCECEELTALAQLLKESKVVDGYRVEQLGDQFYVVLLRHKLIRHVDATGVPAYERLTTVVEWGELRLTRTDVQQIIARFELKQSEPPTTPRNTPVTQLYAYKTGVIHFQNVA